ncbi:MAG: oxidoreductase [Sphingomonas bacterium]|nr:oxidoreductase [Sphingomonas bacterium]
MTPVRVAMVGCGAIAELGHLPGAAVAPDVEVTVLIDRDEARARALAETFGIAHVETDFARAGDYAEAAIVALPPHLHRPAAETLFAAGLHVLMEKPLATSVADSDAMIAAAAKADRVLAVAMMRRFARSARYLKALIDSGMLGTIKSYHAASGAADAWPSRSPFTFDAAQAGGGALISNGCHDVDLMLWLLGPIDTLDFRSDSDARMEGNCVLACRLHSGTEALIEISRTCSLSNTIRIEGERGVVIAPLMGEAITVLPLGASADLLPDVPPPPLDYAATMAAQLADFVAAVRGERAPIADGRTGRNMIALVERCYAEAKPLSFAWDVPVTVAA